MFKSWKGKVKYSIARTKIVTALRLCDTGVPTHLSDSCFKEFKD